MYEKVSNKCCIAELRCKLPCVQFTHVLTARAYAPHAACYPGLLVWQGGPDWDLTSVLNPLQLLFLEYLGVIVGKSFACFPLHFMALFVVFSETQS